MPLTINIDANTGTLAKTIEELKTDLVQFKSTLEKATDTQTIAKLNKSIKETESSLKAIKNISPDFGKNIVPGANQAGNALTNLGRIASDAPFGFIAIQNNLDPLIQSFGFLTKETGSTLGALKALGSQLAGAGGLALAFSVISSLLTAVIQKYGSLGEAIEVLTSDSSSLAMAEKDLGKAFADAEGKAAGEIASIKALLTVARDHTLSREANRQAINKLNSEYDKFLPKLTEENISTKKTQDAVDKLTESIIRQAKIKGLQDLISKETAKQAEIFTKSLGSSADVIDNIIAAAKSLKTGGNFFTEQTLAGAKTAAVNFKEAQDKIDLFTKSLIDLTGEGATAGTLFTKTGKQVDLLAQRISALKDLQAITGLDLAQKIELSQLEVALTKRDAIKLGFKPQEVKEKIQAQIDEIFPQEFTNFRIRGVFTLEPEATKVAKPKPLTDGEKFDIAKATGVDNIVIPEVKITPGKVNVDVFAEMLGDAFADSLATIGENLGKSLATGDFAAGFKDTAKALLGIIGGVLIEIGKQIIVTSALVKSLKSALTGLFGPGGDAAGIAVGIALIATGSLLKSFSFPKMADGGILTQSTMINAGEAGKEAVIPLAKLPYLMSQGGGSGGGNTTVGLRIQGRELIAFIEREKQFANRLS